MTTTAPPDAAGSARPHRSSRPGLAWTELVVHAAADTVWDLLVDTRAWPSWGPTVRAVDHDGARITPSSTGRVQTGLGVWLPFEVTAYDPGRAWSWKVAGIPATAHEVRPVDAGRSVAAFGVPVLAAPYLAVCRVALGRIADLAGQR